MLSLTTVLEAMQKKGVAFDTGLTSSEFERIESDYGFQFPPDLREFLSIGLPVANDFPNWRSGKITWGANSKSITAHMNWPMEGICFDIENNRFWMRDWGAKPDDLREAFRVVRAMVEKAPPLIPVFSHRFLPADPPIEGNPVLSVYQTDIIYYGQDLASYWVHEFELPLAHEDKEPRRIRFWSAIIDGMDADYESEKVS